MSETEMRSQQLSGDANLVGNPALESTMHANMMRLGPPQFDAADQAFAAEIQTTLRQEDIITSYGRFGLAPKTGEALSSEIYPLGSGVNSLVGSTDVGTVSWVVPTVQCRVACYAVGTPGHSWQLVAQGLSGPAHKGLSYAAKIMAGTAADVFADAALLREARAQHAKFRADNPFVNPIAPDLPPPLDMAAH
jgi:aminobenzoyl-glutamate utilization protein B